MTKRERQILTYLTASDEERAANKYNACEFADDGFTAPTANEIKHFVCGLSPKELRRIQDGRVGREFSKNVNAALGSLAPKKEAKVIHSRFSLGN